MKTKDGSLFDLSRLVAVVLFSFLTLAGCHHDGTASPATTSPGATLQSIEVTPTSPSVAAGTSVALTATAIWSNNQHTDVTSLATWTSSNSATATVGGGTGQVEGAAVGNATIAALYQGQSGTASVTVTPSVVMSIALTPAAARLALGTSEQLTATGTFSDGTTQNISAEVTWSSSVSSVSPVSASGLVQSLAVGSSTITATCSASSVCGNISGNTSVTVSAAVLQSIQVAPSLPSVALGLAQQFTATGLYSDGTHQNLTTSVTWNTDATGVATISNASGTVGLASSLSIGTANITATAGNIVSAGVPFTVTAATLVSIAITPSAPSIALGTTQQFTATGTYTDNSTHDLTSTVVWSSGTAGVATISNASPFGLATAVSMGNTSIGAASGSVAAPAVNLTVTAAVLESIQVTPGQSSVALGLTQQFTATGLYSDGTHQDLTNSVMWASDTAGVATISNASGSNGLASSLGVGTANITAGSGSVVSAGVSFTVTSATLVSIDVTPATPGIAAGTTQQFTAIGTYTDNSTQDLTGTVSWSSSATAVATISNVSPFGLATATNVGGTTIQAAIGSVNASVTLTVTAATLQSIKVTPVSVSAPLGESQQFAAIGLYTDGSTQNLTNSVAWSSDSPAVATISNAAGSHGLASTVSVGSANITASSGAIVSPAVAFTVVGAQLVSISVTPSATVDLVLNSTQQLKATGTYTDGTSHDITTSSSTTWLSQGNSVSVTNSGLVTAKGGGSSAVKAFAGGVISNAVDVDVATFDGGLLTMSESDDTFSPYAIQPNGTLLSGPPVASTTGVSGSFMAADPTGNHLYVIAGSGISAYQISGSTLILGPTVTDNSEPQTIAVHPSGQFVYVGDILGNQLSVYTVGSNGTLTLANTFPGVTGAGPDAIAFNPSGTCAYVANGGDGTVSEFTVAANGTPTLIGSVPVGNTPIGIAIDPTGKYVYVVNASGSYISQFTIGAGGALVEMMPPFVSTGTTPLSIAMHPSGKYVYVVNTNDMTVAEFPVGAGGALGTATTSAPFGVEPVYIATDFYGKYAFVADALQSAIFLFNIGSNGLLSPSGTVTNADAPGMLIATPPQF